MIDSVGNVSSVLLVGAGNPLCFALLDQIIGPRLTQAFLIDSDEDRLIAAAQRASELGVSDIRTGLYSVNDSTTIRELIAEGFALHDVDVAILGPLGRRHTDELTGPAEDVQAQLVDLVTAAEATYHQLDTQGHGVVVLFSNSRPGPATADAMGTRIALMGADVVGQSLVARSNPRVKVIVSRIDPLTTAAGRAGEVDIDFRAVAGAIVPTIKKSKSNRRSSAIDFPRSLRSASAGLRRRVPGRG